MHKIQGPSIGNGLSNPGDLLRKNMVMIEEECGMRFKVYKVLGEGTYGVVYQALDFTTNKTVALKHVKMEHKDEGLPSTALREIAVLKELDHEGIVKLIDVLHGRDGQKLFMVFEYFNIDLRIYLDRKRIALPLENVKDIMSQVLQALLHCHQKRIMHRDLKPSNLLIGEDNKTIKLADFGLARTFGLPLKTYTHEVVTLWYRAPEILLGAKVYSTAIDMWSLGCIFYELVHNVPLFQGKSEIEQLFKIFKLLGTPNELDWQGSESLPEMKMTFPKWRVNGNESLIQKSIVDQDKELQRKMNQNQTNSQLFHQCPEAVDLLTQMLQLEPSKRITPKAALEHPFFKRSGTESVPQLPAITLSPIKIFKKNQMTQRVERDHFANQSQNVAPLRMNRMSLPNSNVVYEDTEMLGSHTLGDRHIELAKSYMPC